MNPMWTEEYQGRRGVSQETYGAHETGWLAAHVLAAGLIVNELLTDVPFKEGSLPTSDRITVTELPTVAWRMAEAINKVPPLSDCQITGFKDGKMLLKKKARTND